jgi:transcription-repair coupling factor (superfamily II helicase)
LLFVLRGALLDVWAPGAELPVRVEFYLQVWLGMRSPSGPPNAL